MMQTRRDFFRKAAGAAAVGMFSGWDLFAGENDRLGAVLPERVLFRNGVKTTAFGLGGFHVGKTPDPMVAQALVERALELGVRFFDTANGYQKGGSERYYGEFLIPKYRGDIFLSSKCNGKRADRALAILEDSLRNLRTDHLDLWLMHGVSSEQDVDWRVQNGVLDVMLKAREEGKVKYLGFSGHQNPRTHLHFLKLLKERGTPLDAVQMPLNVMDPHFESFQLNVLPELLKETYGVLAMKTMAGGSMMGQVLDNTPPEIAAMGIPDVKKATGITYADMHRYVYGLPVSLLISGCETVQQLNDNVKVLTDYHALSESEKAQLLAATKPFAGNIVENYKRLRS